MLHLWGLTEWREKRFLVNNSISDREKGQMKHFKDKQDPTQRLTTREGALSNIDLTQS
jgi:hypothetical protein